jgi:hypothetical protein
VAVHVCVLIKLPFKQAVAVPVRVKPALHASEQLLPEERTDGQVPMKPFAGADTGHAIPAALPEMDMLKRPAASHPIILFFIILSLRPRRYLPI